MIDIYLLILALAGDPATCPMHAQHAAVDQRGDQVMGFSHHRTKHSFRLFVDGGAVEVRANDAADTESVSAIRAHLKEIAEEFAKGDFARPRQIHGRVPDGAPVMKDLGDAITYRYEELERGGRVRLVTKEKRGVEAIHAFLRFQIADHRTGDAGKIE